MTDDLMDILCCQIPGCLLALLLHLQQLPHLGQGEVSLRLDGQPGGVPAPEAELSGPEV